MTPKQRLAELIDQHLAQRLDAAGRAELEAILREDTANRREFWQRAGMEGLLREWGRIQEGVDQASIERTMPHPGWWKSRRIQAALGMAAAVIISFPLWIHRDHGNERDATNPTAGDALAVLSQTAGARWKPGSGAPQPGGFVGPGDLTLESGWAVLELVSGGEVMIGGPAKIHISSAHEIHCSEGNLTIRQPATSEPFTVHTPTAVVEDIQRQVTLQIRQGETDLLAGTGGVSLRLADGTTRSVSAGEAVGFNRSGLSAASAGTKDKLTSQLRSDEKQRSANTSIPGRWLINSRLQSEDPDLLLRYTFDDVPADARTVPDQSKNTGANDGVISGAAITEGRWPNKKALGFNGSSDGVHMSIPGTYDSVTLTAWIQVKSLDHDYNGLFMSDGIKKGGFHWQILGNGALRMGVLDGTHPSYESPPVITPDTYGKWLHVAVAYDLRENSVRQYLNGQLISRKVLEQARLVQFRSAMLGNWDPADDWDQDMVRNFDGLMDEFSVFRRALTNEEIKSQYELGRN